jgi:hypothetical protein
MLPPLKEWQLMSDLKSSAKWALISFITAAIAFTVNYNWLEGTLPGYRLLTAPGIVILRVFTEEIAFWPKLLLLLGGQYVVSLLIILATIKLIRLIHKRN